MESFAACLPLHGGVESSVRQHGKMNIHVAGCSVRIWEVRGADWGFHAEEGCLPSHCHQVCTPPLEIHIRLSCQRLRGEHSFCKIVLQPAIEPCRILPVCKRFSCCRKTSFYVWQHLSLCLQRNLPWYCPCSCPQLTNATAARPSTLLKAAS